MNPNIHVSRNQVTLGIFSEVQIKEGLSSGLLKPNDYCWTPGMKGWTTLAESFPNLVTGAATIFPAAAGQAQYPSGGERFGAYLLDGLFMGLMACGLAVPLVLMMVVAMDSDADKMANTFRSLSQFIGAVVGFVISFLYHGIQGNSVHQATWGQRIMGFKMADVNTGASPQSAQVWKWSLFRSLIFSCCSCIGWLFFIPILNSARKQSAFDEWADILMVKK